MTRTIAFALIATCASLATFCRAQSASTADELTGIRTKVAANLSATSGSGVLTIKLALTNTTNRNVRFRYIACIECHIDLLDRNGIVVARKEGAPISECPYKEIDIEAGKTIERIASFNFPDFYKVSPGEYSLRLKYDKRLLKEQIDGDPWIPWTNKNASLKIDKMQ